MHGKSTERSNWRLIAGGEGIHWPDLDEDISVKSLLAGRRSGENAGVPSPLIAEAPTAGVGVFGSVLAIGYYSAPSAPQKKYKILLHSGIGYSIIGIKPGRQLPPKRD
jgi:hypothetical protein